MKRCAAPLFALTLLACRPAFDENDGLVSSARVLAVKSEPAEAKPGEPVHFSALIAAPASSDVSAPSWHFCTAPKAAAENNAVSSACLNSTELVSVGRGLEIDAQPADDACSLFGPDTPPGGFRPRDPDSTGGYYQPLRVDLEGAEPVFHLQRIACGLGGATSDVAMQFGAEYALNQNPKLLQLSARVSGESVALDRIPSAASVELSVSFAEAEYYVYYDLSAQSLTRKRESLRVLWYVATGKLDTGASGRAEDDLASTTENRWHAPSAAGKSTLWLVLRDSRGGVDFATYDIDVQP